MKRIVLDSPPLSPQGSPEAARRNSGQLNGNNQVHNSKVTEDILDSEGIKNIFSAVERGEKSLEDLREEEEKSQPVCAFFKPVLAWINQLWEYFLHLLNPDRHLQEVIERGPKNLDEID